jgi:hypothetical protein
MCETLQIAPSTYYDFKAKERDPERRSDRERSDAVSIGATLPKIIGLAFPLFW